MTFHVALKKARSSRKLTLKNLEAITGIPASRLTRFEWARLHPTEQERRALAKSLGVNAWDIRRAPALPKRLHQKLISRGRRHLPVKKPFYPPYDREPRVRVASAYRSYPKLMTEVETLIRRRPDFDEVNGFSERISLGSSLECLYLSFLLAAGAETMLLAPSSISPRLPHAVVCPLTRETVDYRPFPSLVAQDGILIPQVSFKTPKLYTVDFLLNKNETWSAIEIDGRGHDQRWDAERTKALRIPVKRLNEAAVLALVTRFLKKAA